jgi:hypothetical protein
MAANTVFEWKFGEGVTFPSLASPGRQHMMTRQHVLKFEGQVPEDEMERGRVLGHPKVQEATAALVQAFMDAGHPHAAVSKTKRGGLSKAPASPKPAAAQHGHGAE